MSSNGPEYMMLWQIPNGKETTTHHHCRLAIYVLISSENGRES
jgi:hypothetical protein